MSRARETPEQQSQAKLRSVDGCMNWWTSDRHHEGRSDSLSALRRILAAAGGAVSGASPYSLSDRMLRPPLRAGVASVHAGPCPGLRDAVDVQGRGEARIQADADGVLPKARLRKNPPDHLDLRRRIEAARSKGDLQRPHPFARSRQMPDPAGPAMACMRFRVRSCFLPGYEDFAAFQGMDPEAIAKCR